jgi:hypothetical protein
MAPDRKVKAVCLHPDGGIPQAYSGRTRWLYRTLGPTLTQRLVGWKRGVTLRPAKASMNR